MAAYVIRRGRELLVFEQVGVPDAGVQIPAGGLGSGETLREAVLREVREETGLVALVLRSRLHSENRPHPVSGKPRSTTLFVADVVGEAPDAWLHSVSGHGADAGMVFECRFVALPLHRPLADDQDCWLGLIDHDFTTLSRR